MHYVKNSQSSRSDISAGVTKNPKEALDKYCLNLDNIDMSKYTLISQLILLPNSYMKMFSKAQHYIEQVNT